MRVTICGRQFDAPQSRDRVPAVREPTARYGSTKALRDSQLTVDRADAANNWLYQ
jgi:hypothetical protein